MNSLIIRKTLLAMCLISGLTLSFNSCADKEEDEETKPQTTILTFEGLNITEEECGQSFTRDNMVLTLESSYGHEGECGRLTEGCCFVNEPAESFNLEEGSLWICMGRAVVDLSKLGTLRKISVTLGDWGHNQVALYDSEGKRIAVKENTDSSTMETITFDTQLSDVHSVVVSGCECLVENITIEH